MRILITEDDFVSRRLLQRLLERYGECDIANNGVEALEATRLALTDNNAYSLILLDIMMPEMNGREALKAIRSLEAQHQIALAEGAKIIMITSLSDSENVLGSFREGCEAYITKPIDRKKLLDKLVEFHLLTYEDTPRT